MKVLEKTTKAVDEIRIGTSYQRLINDRKVKEIKDSMLKYGGFWEWKPILVNAEGDVIDGQHRLMAAKKAGICSVPVVVIECKGETEEAELFVTGNDIGTKLPPAEFWHARYIIGHPYAKMLYMLNNDKRSCLYNKIKLKGHGGKHRHHFTVPSFAVNALVLGKFHHWTKLFDDQLTQEIIKKSNETIIEKVNEFFQWFVGIAGDDKVLNPIAYHNQSIKAFILLFAKIKETGYFSSSNHKAYKESIGKMKKFPFPSDWLKMEHSTRIYLLFKHWNKRRTVYTVEV